MESAHNITNRCDLDLLQHIVGCFHEAELVTSQFHAMMLGKVEKQLILSSLHKSILEKLSMDAHDVYSNYTHSLYITTPVYAPFSPMMFMMMLWSGSVPTPSRHTTRVPLRSVVAATVAVDVMDVPVLTSVTLN